MFFVCAFQPDERNIMYYPLSLESVRLIKVESIIGSPGKTELIQQIGQQTHEHDAVNLKRNNLLRKNKGLHKKCSSLKKIVSGLYEKKCLTLEQFTELNLRAERVDMTNKLIKKSNCHRYHPKHTPALRKFAVTLHYCSAAAYKHVRQVFKGRLPHPRVIGKWCENSSGDPGFNKQALDILNKRFKSSGQRMICTLTVDELPLRHQTKWTGRKPSGVVDFGAGSEKSGEIATQAYIFIIVCMNENWKIPVAYFLVSRLSAETRANLLKTCLSECYNVGVDIVAIKFDGSASNLEVANLMGCDLKNPACLKTTFSHPICGSEVAIIFDAGQLRQIVRNTFEAKRLIIDDCGKEIRWQLLSNLKKLQNNEVLNFAKKISPPYIHFRNEVMKVKLATKDLSTSVANALNLCNSILKSSLFVNTEGTINFITIFNNLFEVFNSNPSDLNGFKKPLSLQNAHEVLSYLEEVKIYILRLKIYIKYRRVVCKRVHTKVILKYLIKSTYNTGFLAFLICIESLKRLYSNLVVGRRLEYIATYRLSQNHTEMLFGAIRQHGSYNKPNAIEFKENFNQIIDHLKIKGTFLEHCIPLDYVSVTISSAASDVKIINFSVSRRDAGECDAVKIHDEIDEIDELIDGNVKVLSALLDSESVKTTTSQIIGYISGWVASVLVKALKCETCMGSLISDQKLWFHKLIVLKSMGGFYLSSEDVFKVCFKSEVFVKNYIKEKGHRNLSDPRVIQVIKSRILKSFINCNYLFQFINYHSLQQHPTFNHRLHLIRAVIQKFINVRLNFSHNNYYPGNKKYHKGHQNYKLNLFEGV